MPRPKNPPSTEASPNEAPLPHSTTSVRWEILLCGLLLLAALLLQKQAIEQHSLTGDGALHLLAGHQALRYSENLLNWEHPPLVKLVMALPSALGSTPLLPPTDADRSLDAIGQAHEDPSLLLGAMVRGRWLVLLLIAVPALFFCFDLARRWGGPRAGAVLVGLLVLSFSILPFYTILQTDVGALLGFAGGTVGMLRMLERPTHWRALQTGLLWGLGLASKYSVVLLGPALAGTLLLMFLRIGPERRVKRVLLAGCLVAVGALAVLASTYRIANRALEVEDQQRILDQYVENRATLVVDDRLEAYRPLLEWLSRKSPSLGQYALGFLGIRIQNDVGIYSSYFFGEVSSQGRLSYFPTLAAIKLPLALLFAALLTVRGQWRAWRRLPKHARAVILMVIGVYVVVALSSSYNIGFRHLLPILPLVFLPLSLFLARKPRWAAVLLALLAVESFAVAPQWIAATNTWWLGEKNPTRTSFSDGNLEYAQNFMTLARSVPPGQPVGVLYPGKDTRTLAAYSPHLYAIPPGAVDLEAGYYAVSVLVEQYVPAMKTADPDRVHNYVSLKALAQQSERTWEVIRRGEDLGRVAGTFRLYRLAEGEQSERGAEP